jgi:YVTN family beta-propeller protein
MKTKRFISAKFLLVPVLAAAIFSSCKKDEPVQPSASTSGITPGSGVFVTNEGNFQGGNAKVSFYRYSDSVTTEDIFQPINNRPLGDICQGISFINGKAYVVVNNSGKIEVCNPANFLSTKTITGFTSPRYMLQVSATKAYVTDLFAGSVSIVSLSTNTRTGSIPLAGSSEAIAMVNGEVFVSNTSTDKLYVIDPATDAVTDSITVAKGGNSIVTDMDGKLWLLCYGDYFTSTAGCLYRIDPATHTVEQSWPFTTAESPTRLSINAAGDELYYLNFSIYKMPVASATLPATPFITATTQSFYGLAIHPATGEIYATDAVDYSQRGHLLRYTPAGTLRDDKMVGVIPGGIYFY